MTFLRSLHLPVKVFGIFGNVSILTKKPILGQSSRHYNNNTNSGAELLAQEGWGY